MHALWLCCERVGSPRRPRFCENSPKWTGIPPEPDSHDGEYIALIMCDGRSGTLTDSSLCRLEQLFCTRKIFYLKSLLTRRCVLRTKFECQWRSEEHTSELQSLMRISYAVF